jgi:hypothetical protein
MKRKEFDEYLYSQFLAWAMIYCRRNGFFTIEQLYEIYLMKKFNITKDENKK